MSVRLLAGEFLYRGAPYASGYPDLATAFPIASLYSLKGLLYRHSNTSGFFECLVCYARKSDGGAPYFFTGREISGNWRIDAGGTVVQTGTLPPTGEWVQFAIRIDSSHSTEKATLLWKHLTDVTWAGKLTTASGSYGNPGRFFLSIDEWQADGGNASAGNTSLSNVAVWNVSKTDAELLTEADSANVIDTTNLWAWWPMNDPTGFGTDASTHARPLLITGTPAAGTNSGLEVPLSGGSSGGSSVIDEFGVEQSPADWFDPEMGGWFDPTFEPASGTPTGTAYTQSLAGALTFTGVARESITKPVAGALTSSGLAREAITKAVAGALTSSGLAREAVVRALAGALTSAGAISRISTKPVAGALASSGALRKAVARTVVGAMTPSGVATTFRVVVQMLVGALASSGTVQRSAGRALAGGLAPAAMLRFAVAWTLRGAIIPSGKAGLGYRRTFTGTLTPSGESTTRGIVAIVLTGAVGFAGTVQRGLARQLVGTLMSVGVVRKQGGLTLGGSVHPTGTFYRTFPLLLTGSVAFVGGVGRSIQKGFRSVLTFAGVIAEHLPVTIATVLRSRDHSQPRIRGRDVE